MSVPNPARFRRPARAAGFALFVSLALSSAGALAAEIRPGPSSSPPCLLATSAPPLVAEESRWTWSRMLKPLEFVQGSRRNMIQLATVGMCIALYIIWWRRAA